MEAKKILSPSEQLKQEFEATRNSIPDITFKKFADFVTVENKTYETREGVERIRNTFYGRGADYILLKLLMRYKDEFAN